MLIPGNSGQEIFPLFDNKISDNVNDIYDICSFKFHKSSHSNDYQMALRLKWLIFSQLLLSKASIVILWSKTFQMNCQF